MSKQLIILFLLFSTFGLCVTLNSPANNSYVVPGYAMLNFTVNDLPRYSDISVYVSNNSANVYKHLIFHRTNLANGTYKVNFSNPILSVISNVNALFHFDNLSVYGESNTVAYDFSGKSNNAVISNAKWNQTRGKFAGAYRFNGTNSITPVYLADSATLDLPRYTISVWFKRMGTGTNGGFSTCGGSAGLEPLTAKGGGGGDGGGIDANWVLGYYNGVLYGCSEDATGANQIVTGTTAISNDVWYHVVLRHNATHMTLFLNGNLEATASASAASATNAIQVGIGTLYETASNTIDGAFNGIIDELQIYNGSLTDSQIKSLYHLNNQTYYWKINTTSSNSAVSNFIFDVVDITSPVVTLRTPLNATQSSSLNVLLNCSATDAVGLSNMTLYYNATNLNNDGTSTVTQIQSYTFANTYSAPRYSLNMSLTNVAIAGNLLLTAVAIDKASGTITVPSGFTLINKGEGGIASGAFAYKIAVGGEKWANWTWTANEEGSGWFAEYDGFSSNPLDVIVENEAFLSTATNSISTGTTSATSQINTVAFAIFAADTGTSVGTVRSYTNGFDIIAEKTDTSGSPFISVANLTLTNIQTVETTISHSGSDECYAAIAVFKTDVGLPSTKTWHANKTKTLSGASGYTIFDLNLTNGWSYQWNCRASDIVGNKAFASKNYTFSVNFSSVAEALSTNLISPANGITSVTTSVNFTCNTSDETELRNVSLYFNQSISGQTTFSSFSTVIASSANDAEECIDGTLIGTVYPLSTDLELGTDASVCTGATGKQWVGLRFASLSIPPGAIIWNASLEFEIDVQQSATTNLLIWGQNIDSAPIFPSAQETTSNLSLRARTSTAISWLNVPNNAVDTSLYSPNISAVIQEIINRPGWSTNNAIVFLINGSGVKETESYDGEAAAAVILTVNYTTASGSTDTMTLNSSAQIGGKTNSTTFLIPMQDGKTYKWTCKVYDNQSNYAWANENRTVTINTAYVPSIASPQWCSFHSMHTTYSDGNFAQDAFTTTLKSNYDCGSSNDHDTSLDQTEWTDWINRVNADNIDNNFTYFFGTEWTGSQHIPYITNSPSSTQKDAADADFNTVAELANWLNSNQGVGHYAHPARTSGNTDWSNSANYNTTWIPNVEIQNRHEYHWSYYWNCSVGSGCTDSANPYQPGQAASGTGWIKKALDAGLHLGFVCGMDDHSSPASLDCYTGLANKSTTWTRSGIRAELLNRHNYAAEDKIQVSFTANNGTKNFMMGDIFKYTTTANTITLNYVINASLGDTISSVRIFRNGIIVNVTNFASANIQGNYSLSLVNETETYTFIEVIQSDNSRAWSSPMYITLYENGDGTTPSNSCSCPSPAANWEINMGHHCNITTNCAIGAYSLSFVNAIIGGYCNVSAVINASVNTFIPKNTVLYLTPTATIFMRKT